METEVLMLKTKKEQLAELRKLREQIFQELEELNGKKEENGSDFKARKTNMESELSLLNKEIDKRTIEIAILILKNMSSRNETLSTSMSEPMV
ncbi:MAG TPA: hypothetical protein PLP33_31300 [Leptospiraceae bacterium]|nr:hypothetical protein [Leptospiraceae bacterium]